MSSCGTRSPIPLTWGGLDDALGYLDRHRRDTGASGLSPSGTPLRRLPLPADHAADPIDVAAAVSVAHVRDPELSDREFVIDRNELPAVGTVHAIEVSLTLV